MIDDSSIRYLHSNIPVPNCYHADVPWRNCDNYWNTPSCVNPYDRKNLTCWSSKDMSTYCILNGKNFTKAMLSDPVKEFWE